jgi:DNA-binding SARP family transcriptional activator
MIRILAVGQCGIELDGKRLSAESEVVFGVLLYLAARSGELVPRQELQSMFWPDIAATRGRHCLRQVAYRLRQLGVPLRSDNTSLGISEHDVTLDFGASFSGDASSSYKFSPMADILSGYHPTLSRAFALWVEDLRTEIGLKFRQRLVRTLVDLRSKGRYREVEPVARACLTVDPFNEIATLSLAEAAVVLNGNRAEAMSILDRYINEVGETTEKRLALSASILKRRIGERFNEQRYLAPPEPPFIGREAVLEFLVQSMHEAVTGRDAVVYLWGEPGIGKTRILNELMKVANVRGVCVELCSLSPNDVATPLALFLSLLPRLLQMPGAAGISPEAYDALNRLIEPSHSDRNDTPTNPVEAAKVFRRLKASICELVQALSEERPLALLIDDVHWSDPRSLEVLAELVQDLRGHRILLILASREPVANAPLFRLDGLVARAATRRLSGLAPREVEVLLNRIAVQRNFELTPEFVRRTTICSAGNPLFVSELATHYGWNGVRDDLPHNMQTLLERRLDILSAGALLLFQACAIAGEDGTAEHIARMLDVPVGTLVQQLQELENAGLITTQGANILCRHQLLAREALRRVTPSTATTLHWSLANVLRTELETSLDLRSAHSCLRHLVDAHQKERGVRLAIEIARRLLDNGATEDARDLIRTATILGPTGREAAEVLALRLRAARAAADWHDLTLALAECPKLTSPLDTIDEGELRLMAFEARTYLGESTSRQVGPHVALLSSDKLIVPERKSVAINALIACCDSFDVSTAEEIFRTNFRSEDSRLATFDDLIGNLLYHTSFGSLDTAMEVASRLVRQCAQSNQYGHRETQLLRWCSAPFHFAGDESESKNLLAESRELAQARGLAAEIQMSRIHESFFALDLEDRARASEAIARVVAALPAPSAFWESTLGLLQMRQAILEGDCGAAARGLAALELRGLPDCARVHLNVIASRIRLLAETNQPCALDDLCVIQSASIDVLSSIEVDWIVSAACAYALKNETHVAATCELLKRFLPVRRARFGLPVVIRHFLSAIGTDSLGNPVTISSAPNDRAAKY